MTKKLKNMTKGELIQYIEDMEKQLAESQQTEPEEPEEPQATGTPQVQRLVNFSLKI